jgi:hypothetical protein
MAQIVCGITCTIIRSSLNYELKNCNNSINESSIAREEQLRDPSIAHSEKYGVFVLITPTTEERVEFIKGIKIHSSSLPCVLHAIPIIRPLT